MRTTMAVLALAGCTSELDPRVVPGDLIVSPGLIDAGVAPVGVATGLEVFLDATLADVEVVSGTLLSIEGPSDAFFLRGCDPEDDTLRTTASLRACTTVARGETEVLEVVFLPPEPGLYQARLEVASDARRSGGLRAITLRGQAAWPDGSVRPLGIDFGPVSVGEDRVETVEILNRSLLPLAVSLDTLAPAVFAVETELPVVVPPDGRADVAVRFAPLRDDVPTLGELYLDLGGTRSQRVTLRGNDCGAGLPDAYDRDGDRWTTCGGDCDDRPGAGAEVHPGAEERLDGRDQDCDGLVDEGTEGYDDDGDGYTELEGDCHDGDASVHPGVEEICPSPTLRCTNGIDDDCDGVVDNGSEDRDGDGFSVAGGDCDDDPATGTNVRPGAPERPNGVDDDCDGRADEGTALYDDDGDGFCEGGIPGFPSCTVGGDVGDCDDSTVLAPAGPEDHPGFWIWPDAPEAHDGPGGGFGVDNDCDGVIDERTVWFDDDGDGVTEEAGDCDDDDDTVGPGEAEDPTNDVDDDCDGLVDETDPYATP